MPSPSPHGLSSPMYLRLIADCRIPLRSKPVQATDRADLKKLLSEQVAGGIFFTTIQKLAPEKGHDTVEEINPRSNIIVICDEAHRTQYGFKSDLDMKGEKNRYGRAKYMHDALAFYETLRENESAVRDMGNPVLKALAHELTDKLRKSATIDWQKRDTARARMRLLVKVLLTKYKYPPDKQPEAVDKIIEQAELYADSWVVEGA